VASLWTSAIAWTFPSVCHCALIIVRIKQVELEIFSKKNKLRRTLTHMGRPSPFIHFLFYR
jgi:hypothetical protein